MRGHMQVGVFQKTLQLDGVVITARSLEGVNQLFVYAGVEVKEKKYEWLYEYPPVLSGFVAAKGYASGEIDEEYLEQKREEKRQRVEQEFADRGETPSEEDLMLTEREERLYSQPTGRFAWTQKTVDVYPDLVEQQTVNFHKSSTLAARPWGPHVNRSGLVSIKDPRDYKSYRWFSGALFTGPMSKCVQMVMGIHRSAVRALTELPPFLAADEETARIYLESGEVLPPSEDYVKKVEGHDGFCPQYDCSWARTDNLIQGQDGWWLVRVMRGKVYARRLPVFLGSDFAAFAEYYYSLGLESVAKAIEYFRGLPTGEGFPEGEEFAKGLEAGWIKDITPATMPFSDAGWGGYYADSGWSFSPDGMEAHNTGLRYSGDTYHSRWGSLYFSFTRGAFGEEPRVNARIHRTDEIYAPPAGATKVQWIPYKVPFGFSDGMVSTVLLPTEDFIEPKASRAQKVYDAVVWVGFVGEELQTLSYYHNPKTAPEKVEEWGEAWDGLDRTMPGAWEWGEKRSATAVPTCMYSSNWDTREVSFESEAKYKRVQKKLYEFWYHSINETGNALAYEWPIFSKWGRFEWVQEGWGYRHSDYYRTAAVAYADRSVYSGASGYQRSYLETYKHEQHDFTARGKWRAQGFRCEFWIWFSWRLDCAGDPETVWRAYDEEYERSLYHSRCGQKCEWQLGMPDQHDFRTMVVCVEDYPQGTEYVTEPRPAVCSDFTELRANSTQFLPANTEKSKGEKRESKSDPAETKGWYNCPAAPAGHRFDDFDLLEMQMAVGRISPDTDTGEFHTALSSRNCFGYTYEGFANHLVEGPGYGKIGRLHAEDSEIARFNIVFVGVLDGE